MRPHRLRVTAFGAFADTVEVDFDELSRHGLVLLHGDTGAGKTTLLDAVGYALFGRVPGARHSVQRLRSDHAGPEVRTAVQLEATIGGRRVRVTRYPPWERPKRRGGGTTREHAEVVVELDVPGRPGGDGLGAAAETLVLTRHEEAASELGRLLGMSAEQFFQVVLLPQGEFASFLRADAAQRADVLTRLFDTQRFGAVEDWLAQRRRETAQRSEAAQQAFELASTAVAAASGEEAGEEVGGAGTASADRGAGDGADGAADDGAELPADLGAGEGPGDAAAHARADGQGGWLVVRRAEALLEAARSRLTSSEAALAAAVARREAATGRREQAASLADRQRRRREVESELTALRGQEGELGELRQELAAATAAAEVAEVVRLAGEAAATAREAARKVAPALAAAGLPSDPEPDPAELEAVAGQWHRRLGVLTELAEVETAARADEADREAAAGEAQRASQTLTEVEADLAVLPVRRATAQQQLDAAAEARSRLPALETALERADEVSLLASELREALTVQHRAELAELTAAEAERDALDRVNDLRRRRLAGMAGELAAALVAGEPCPVCGGREHPSPATAAQDSAGPESEDAAADQLQRARDAAAGARSEAARAVERVTGLAHRLGGAAEQAQLAAPTVLAALAGRLPGALQALDRDVVDFAERRRAAAEAVASQQAVAEAYGDRAEELAAVGRDETRLVAAQADLRAAAAAATQRAEAATARLATTRERLAAVLAGATDVRTAAVAAERSLALASAAAAAVAERDRSRQAAERAEAAAATAATAAGFADVAAASAALRSADWRQAGAEQLAVHDRERHRCESALAAEDLAVPLDPPADLAAAEEALSAAQAGVDAATSARALAAGRLADLERLVPELRARHAALTPFLAEAEQARALADLASGDGQNRLRMSLSSYVLAARLEQVAAAATERLSRMSGGRYTLVHTDERARGNRRSGLGLAVVDAWTGRQRATATLSGGETFLASLALALGLADVVTAEAGGARLDALFVDEGFGTLDEDALDEALAVLDELRAHDRLVGIVSHVPELRSRVSARLHVRKGRRGSTVEPVLHD